MQSHAQPLALARVISITTALIILITGVTFAALQSQQNVLAGNTISTATANLQLSTDGTTYADSRTGFDFNNIIPGGSAVPAAGYSFYLKNAGGTPLTLKLAVGSTPTNPSGVDLSKVNVILTTVGSGAGSQSFTLQSLLTPGGVSVTGASLASASAQQYKLQVSMAVDAVTSSSANLGNIDFDFSGTAVAN
jgi:hypothetical protein